MGVSIGVNKIQRKIPMFAFDLQKCFARTNQGRLVNSLCQNIIESFEKEEKSFSDIGKDAKLLPAGKKIKKQIFGCFMFIRESIWRELNQIELNCPFPVMSRAAPMPRVEYI